MNLLSNVETVKIVNTQNVLSGEQTVGGSRIWKKADGSNFSFNYDSDCRTTVANGNTTTITTKYYGILACPCEY